MHFESDNDHYGDGDVPEVDDKPYQDNNYDPHPEAAGENNTHRSRKEYRYESR